METITPELFTMTFVAVLLAMATWSALRWTAMAYLRHRELRRQMALPRMNPIDVPLGSDNMFTRIMEAQEELNLAALDIPDDTLPAIRDHQGEARVLTPEPWLQRLLDASHNIKKAIPESNQRAMRALAMDRAKFKGAVDTDDADIGP